MGSAKMNQAFLVLGLVLAATVAGAQQTAQDSSGYTGVSQPPADPIVTTEAPQLPQKPSAGVLAQTPQPSPSGLPPSPSTPSTYGPPPAPGAYSRTGYAASTDSMPGYGSRAYGDPDGDMVHPRAAREGELVEGATIRVRLIDRLSSTLSEKGQIFRGQVASDVLQDGKVLIPAGSGIEGRVTNVSSGHFGGHGSFRLKPEVVILPDGTRYELHAYTTGTPGSKTRVGAEGTINPGSRAKKNGIEYGAVVGTGAVTGAILGGPVGALAGSLVGAGMVTTHIMVDHAQAALEPGAVLLFTLTEPMNLIPPPGQPGS